jgi:thiamine biosynthesis lipoprotein
LRGRSALDAVNDLLDAVPSTVDLAPIVSGGRYLVTLRRQAMATDFVVMLNAGQYADAPRIAVEALNVIDQLEAQLTVYRETSEILEINRTAAGGPVEVESQLFALLQLALKLHAETNGAYDITAGPLSKAWGFFQRQGTVPEQATIDEALSRVGSEKIVLDAAQQTINFAQSGVELNLGSIGKGYALDRAAAVLLEQGVGDFLLHGGQSSILAQGSRATGDLADQGWRISIGDPLRPGKTLLEFPLVNGAVGTSGTQFQFFREAGKRYGHILDPRSGWPAEKVISATVVAPTAALADALSTAFFILGPQETETYCAAHPEIAAVLLAPSAQPGSPELWRFNWDETS